MKDSEVEETKETVVRDIDQCYKTWTVDHSGQPQKRYKVIVERRMTIILKLSYNLYHLYFICVCVCARALKN
jgi:hypothetical protein